MKLTLKKWINSSIKIATLVTALTLLVSSCSEEVSTQERAQDERALEAAPTLEGSGTFGASLLACPNNLTNDGCNFTSGSGEDYPNQYLMVNMMNPCRTEGLPAGCAWDGYITQTRDIEVDLSNCCYPFSSLNFQMNSWKGLAITNRPASNYLITNYQRISGYMVTTYGPYRMKIRVTYRKKGLCSLVGEREVDIIALPQ
jgi:hypothetical protein